MPDAPRIPAERMISLGIRLLEALSSSAGQTLDIGQAAKLLGVPASSIPQIVDTLCSLSDRANGTRAVLTIEDGAVRLVGDSAQVMPLRLSIDEGIVLAHILTMLDIDQGTRERVGRALMPLDGTPDAGGIAESPVYGSWYPQISEAIDDGIRCRIIYRSLTQDAATERTIDPLALIEEPDAVYLLAWDVVKDGERRYRLDRIQQVTFTDDSVEAHDTAPRSTAESLREDGFAAHIAVQNDYLAQLNWAGLDSIVPHEGDRSLCTVYCSSEAWLFDQVLSAGGALEIVEPGELRGRFVSYAKRLTES